MAIKKVSLIGLGALGVLFGNQMAKSMPEGAFCVIADQERIKRYQTEGVYCNGGRCTFRYVLPEEPVKPADLLLFAVKYNALAEAIVAAKNHVGENTVILSLLNGITSEQILGEAFGAEKVLFCVAQGMDAVKTGNRLTYRHRGMLCFGDGETGVLSEKAKAVAAFFENTGVPFQLDTDMKKRLWGKFMLNVGVNQTASVFCCSYGGLQKEGAQRETMIAAMREVIALSGLEGAPLTDEDLSYWLGVLASLNPEGKPSMQQDREAGRKSEVELFSGTVCTLGKKHGIPTPVNDMLYEKVVGYEALT